MSEITEEKITEVLKRVWAREQAAGRDPVYNTTPLDELLARERGEEVEEHTIRVEAFRRLLEYFFGDGPHPGQVVRRVFAITKALRPALILNMSLEEIGLMLGETKAAGSWRIKQLVNRPIARSCGHETQLPWQKSSSAVANYAATRRRKHQENQQSHR